MKPWVKTGLFFAMWLFIWMTFVVPYIFVWIGLKDENEPKFNVVKITISIVVYTIAGLIYGYVTRNRKNAKKQIEK